MKYISTRGEAPALGFEDVMLAGLARDGGLYVPEVWPRLERPRTPGSTTTSEQWINGFRGQPYHEVAFEVMWPFVGDEVDEPTLRRICGDSYATFQHSAVAPLVQVGSGEWILELFHGPTLAFKDIAMQVLARLMDWALEKRGERATILGATSGDTGGAAIEAFRGRETVDVFILFPNGRVSDVQRRQMTTPVEDNVHAIAIDGNFDDCQNLVKALFNDLALRDRLRLSGVNSINWARIMAQVVYYHYSAANIGGSHAAVSFAVPTGNFGDIFAGYVAKQMGLPVFRLGIATNVNDILPRTLATGRYEPKGVVATQSPSMDIQISSNFERLLFDLSCRKPGRVRKLMDDLKQTGAFELSASERQALEPVFEARHVTEEETRDAMAQLYKASGYVADPHTAVGVAAARKFDFPAPVVMLATAHPAKFPEAVLSATGRPPPKHEHVVRQKGLKERMTVLPNDFSTVAKFISARSRAAREGVA